MSSRNDEVGTYAGAGVLLSIGVMIWFAVLIVGIAAFLTLIALCAQFKPVKFRGEIITARDGRFFILYGFISSLVAIALTPVIANAMGHTAPDQWMPYVAIFGYSVGSIGIEWIVETFWGEDKKEPEAASPSPEIVQPTYAPPSAQVLHFQKTKADTFASWNDDHWGPRK